MYWLHLSSSCRVSGAKQALHMETMQAEYRKQNYVVSNAVSCDRTGGEIPAGIFTQVLEYKYSLNGLIEDIESGVKNTNDINLVVAWEAGERYKDNYIIESLLIAGNEGLRRYHGVTHHLHDANTNEYVCDLILLQDLILYLNDKNESDILQETYDE